MTTTAAEPGAPARSGLKAGFDENGYAHVPGAFTGADLATIQDEVDAMIERCLRAGRRLEAHWGGDWRDAIDVEGTSSPGACSRSIGSTSIRPTSPGCYSIPG